MKNKFKKVKVYKGWVIATNGEEYHVFSVDEWGYGEGFRTAEFECGSVMECKANIDSY
ncbi:MAG: hypothetical protein ACYC2U_08240 [Candidatus Amoebophilus sp.]